MNGQWLLRLDQTTSTYSIFATLIVAGLIAALLARSGVLGWAFELFGRLTRWALLRGFQLWEQWFSAIRWELYLVITITLLLVGGVFVSIAPAIAAACAAAVMLMGTLAALAYMYIDVERYEVQRGRKAIHNPTKGQELATHVAAYGHVLGVPLLGVGSVGVIGAFALLNQALYESIGRQWFQIESGGQPVFMDFLVYALINLLSLVDVLDLADSRQLIHASFVRKGTWQTGVLLGGFRSFFTLILLQQVFASVRHGRLLAETISDFWSPHEPIHDRARSTLPQFGAAAIDPLLSSLGEMTALTKEQRDQLPIILSAIGPSTIPPLSERLSDPREHVRVVAVSALGRLGARGLTPEIAALCRDPNELVRQSAVEALGFILSEGERTERSPLVKAAAERQGRWAIFRSQRSHASTGNATLVAIMALQEALRDSLASIRSEAAISLGQAGAAAIGAAEPLTDLLHDADETVRCRAAEALGKVGGPAEKLLPALDDPATEVRAAAARGLKLLGRDAGIAVPRLLELLQDRDETVRQAATEAISAAGPLDGDSTVRLAEGLSSPDTLVRAQTAEALGTIEASTEHAAPSLVGALEDGNDVVRAKAAEALGKLGEKAADVAIPSLVRALRDQDSWVSALAAEALGEMGEVKSGALPALVRALSHVSPRVRANSAESLGKLGPAAASARVVVERSARDEDGGVRAAAIRALGAFGSPPRSTLTMVREATADADPQVRAAAVKSLGQWMNEGQPENETIDLLLPLLRDPNDDVKVQAADVLSQSADTTGAVVRGLSNALAQDDSAWVRVCMALALAKIGHAAAEAGAILLRAVRTGEAEVREQAMRAVVMIQPPEAAEAFAAGMADPVPEVRLIASAGWIKAQTVPEEAVPVLVDALRDPEVQVRANAANALGRLEKLPDEAIPALMQCAADANDGLRLNAAVALQGAQSTAVNEVMYPLLDDPNVRIRLVAARAILEKTPGEARAVAAVEAAASDTSPRVRQAIEELTPLMQPPISPTEDGDGTKAVDAATGIDLTTVPI
jgi:HEAT repeat protein